MLKDFEVPVCLKNLPFLSVHLFNALGLTYKNRSENEKEKPLAVGNQYNRLFNWSCLIGDYLFKITFKRN